MKPRSPAHPFAAYLFVALLLFFGAYMGAYYGLLKRKAADNVATSGPVLKITRFVPTYRNHNQVFVITFYPANCVDRLVRREYWTKLRGWDELVPPSS